jgi:membrane-associated phospholipid phosphatase
MRKKVLLVGLICLLLFALFSWAVKRGAFRDADFAFTVKLQEAIDTSPRLRLSRLVGEVMGGSTFFASPEVSIVGVLAITAITLYDWKKKKIRWISLVIPVLFFLLVLGEIYGKTVVHHPAPPFFMIKNPTSIFPKYYINEQFSYPSGHAARSVFLALSIFYFLPSIFPLRKKKVVIGMICVGYILLVSVSRVYFGHHWLSDVVGGWLLGSSMGILTAVVY